MPPLIKPCEFSITVSSLNETSLFRSLMRRHLSSLTQSYHQTGGVVENVEAAVEIKNKQVVMPVTEQVSNDPAWNELFIKDKKLPLKLLAEIPQTTKHFLESAISIAISAAPEILRQFLLPVSLVGKSAEEPDTELFYSSAVNHDFEKIKLEMDIIDNVLGDIRYLAGTVLAIFENPNLPQYQNKIFTEDYHFHPDIVEALETGSSVADTIVSLLGVHNAGKVVPLPIGFDIGEIGLNSPINFKIFNIFANFKEATDDDEQIQIAREGLKVSKQQRNLTIAVLVISLLTPSYSSPVSLTPSEKLAEDYAHDLRESANRNDSTLAQQMLKELGYYQTAIDGKWGDKSIEAANQLCSDMNMVCRDYHSQVFIIHLAKIMSARNQS